MWELFLPSAKARLSNYSRKEISQITCVGLVSFAFFVVHLLFLIYYAAAKLWPLVIINSVSVLLYLAGVSLNREGHTGVTIFLINAEICCYCVLNILLLGWSASTQWFLPTAMLPCQIMYPLKRRHRAYYVCLLVVSMYVCYYLGNTVEPLYADFDQRVIIFMNVTTVLISNAIVVHYSSIVSRVTELYYKQRIASLSNEANLDPLTGLWNRRYVMERLEELTSQEEARFSVAMLDVDYFKDVNDAHGHPFGDLVLRQLAAIIMTQIRSDDVAVRWGGEEFLIVLGQASSSNTIRKMEALRALVEETTFSDGYDSVNITITVGVCEYAPGMPISQLISQSDVAMYYGKKQGRNQIALYSDISIMQ